MRILIMVLSYNESPYKELMQAQKDTWACKYGSVYTIFYMGSELEASDDACITSKYTNLKVPCSDNYYLMHWKFKLALDWVHKKELKYDFIFRTNSSSYINVDNLRKVAEHLPKEKLYSGWDLERCVSGAGIWMSKDVAELLRDKIPAGEQIEEDVLIGDILNAEGISILPDFSRIDLVEGQPAPIKELSYHYRFKTEDRLRDATKMHTLHKFLNP